MRQTHKDPRNIFHYRGFHKLISFILKKKKKSYGLYHKDESGKMLKSVKNLYYNLPHFSFRKRSCCNNVNKKLKFIFRG